MYYTKNVIFIINWIASPVSGYIWYMLRCNIRYNLGQIQVNVCFTVKHRVLWSEVASLVLLHTLTSEIQWRILACGGKVFLWSANCLFLINWISVRSVDSIYTLFRVLQALDLLCCCALLVCFSPNTEENPFKMYCILFIRWPRNTAVVQKN